MSNNEFTKILANKYIRADVVKKLNTNPQLRAVKKKELEFIMENCERDIFQKFRDNELSVDQLSQRVVERRFGLKYKTLDDLKPFLLPQFFDESVKERIPVLNLIYGSNPSNINRELLPHEINFKCLKSVNSKPTEKILKPSHCFKSTTRSKVFNPHRNKKGGGYINDDHCDHQHELETIENKLKDEKEKNLLSKNRETGDSKVKN